MMETTFTKLISRESFSQFGTLLDHQSQQPRIDNATELKNLRNTAHSNLLLALADPAKMPLKVSALERHLYSSQTFFPLDVSRYLVIVCPSKNDGEPDLQKIEAFEVKGSQGINYYPGTWHYPMTALSNNRLFAVLVWEDGSENDTEWRYFSPECCPIVNLRENSELV